MLQVFATRSVSVRDFEEWYEGDELVLEPKFQRRSVWSDKARYYLMDTIIRGKPIPKIYMRQDINVKTKRTRREIVDGQQRLRTVLSFLQDGFKISKTHNKELAGKLFSELDKETQKDILRYEFVVDLLQDLPDKDIHDIFRRLNTYAVTLNHQELRNAYFFGEFRTSVYALSNEYFTFWTENKIFTDINLLRMYEVELVSELLIAMMNGITGKNKRTIDAAYKKYDNIFPARDKLENQFRTTIDTIGQIVGETLAVSKLHGRVLFYPLFCTIYHMLFRLKDLDIDRTPLKKNDYPKVRIALEDVDEIFEKLEQAKQAEIPEDSIGLTRTVLENSEELDPLTPEERRFYNAFSKHWVHAPQRRIMTEYMCKLILNALEL